VGSAGRSFIALVALSFGAGCADSEPAAGVCPNPIFDGEIPVQETDATIAMTSKVSASTSDPASPVQVAVQDNQGTIDFAGSGPVPAFIYKRIPWPDVGYTLYAGLGVTDGAWLLFWLYCAPDGTLGRFYGERTDATGTLNVVLNGRCDETAIIWDQHVQVPAHTLRNIPMTCGFTVTTPDWDASVDLGSSRPGKGTLFGLPATALVFSTTDCRTGCGAASWFELHSILYEPTMHNVGFAVWYLNEATPGTGVSAENGVMMPGAGWNEILDPRATWTLSW